MNTPDDDKRDEGALCGALHALVGVFSFLVVFALVVYVLHRLGLLVWAVTTLAVALFIGVVLSFVQFMLWGMGLQVEFMTDTVVTGVFVISAIIGGLMSSLHAREERQNPDQRSSLERMLD
jgi:ATP/ADP translocase